MVDSTTETTTQETKTETAIPEETVSKAELQKVLDEMHKFKKEAKEAKTELEKQKIEKLKDQQNWQAIAELKEKEAVEYQEKFSALSENLIFDKKIAAVKEAALKQGILSTAMDDLEMYDMSSVVIEKTSTGRINVLGADQWVQALKMRKPYMFETKGSKVNPETPGVTGSKNVGWDEVKVAQAAWKKNPSKENEAKYKAMLIEFQRQTN